MPLINRVGGGSAELQSKTVKSTTSQQTITPDEGYDGISDITVSPIKLQSRTGSNGITPSTSTQNITPSSLYDGLAKVEIKPIPSSYVKPSATQAAKEWTPTTYDQTISAGTYCSGQQTIKGDSDLVEENIISGKTVFGVTGTGKGFIDSEVFQWRSSGRVSAITFSLVTDNLIGLFVATQIETGGVTALDTDERALLAMFVDITRNFHVETFWQSDVDNDSRIADDGSIQVFGNVSCAYGSVTVSLSQEYMIAGQYYHIYPIYSVPTDTDIIIEGDEIVDIID